MTTKKAAKTTFFARVCTLAETHGFVCGICQRVYNQKIGACAWGRKKVRNPPPSTRLKGSSRPSKVKLDKIFVYYKMNIPTN